MAAVNGFYAEQLTAATTQDTTYTRGDTDLLPQIAAASLSASTKYLIIAEAMLAGDHGNDFFFWRINTADDTSIAAKSEMVVEPTSATLTDRGLRCRFVHSFTTDSVPADIDMQFKCRDAADVASVDQASLKVVELTDRDFVETISADPGDQTDEYPDVTQAVEWTIPGSSLGTDEHLVFAYQRTQPRTTNKNYRVEIHTALDTSTSAVRAKDENEGEDSAELRNTGFFGLRHKASSGTPDIEIYTWEEDDAANMFDRGGYGIAFVTSDWESITFAYTAATTVIDSTERTMQSIDAFSPPTTADHLIFGSVNLASMNGIFQHLHVEDDGTPIRTGDQPMAHATKYDATATPHVSVFHETNILSSNTSDYDLQGATDDADDDTAEHRWLTIWSMELADAQRALTTGPGGIGRGWTITFFHQHEGTGPPWVTEGSP